MLSRIAEPRRALANLIDAKALAERLNDDRRRGGVHVFMTNAHLLLGEVDEALACGTQALEIADRIGDMGIRILTSTYLAQAHYHRGDYEQAVAIATGNLALRSADGVYEVFGIGTPPSVYDHCWLMGSLAEIGRFAETPRPKPRRFGSRRWRSLRGLRSAWPTGPPVRSIF